jgi:hypothetical protein
MDIEAWLQGLGLERYAPAFRDNEIDWEVLPKLTLLRGPLLRAVGELGHAWTVVRGLSCAAISWACSSAAPLAK